MYGVISCLFRIIVKIQNISEKEFEMSLTRNRTRAKI